ncbi:MAG: FHA domain-containing protein [Thermoguttaceae bacterium]
MEVELTITDHYAMETRVVVRQLPVVLGRDEKADVYLKDPWTSHRHCSLSEQGGRLVVCDLQSKNGIFMGGHRVTESPLGPGDRFTIGRTEITVHYQHGGHATADELVPAQSPPLETLDLLYGVTIEADNPPKPPDDGQ